MKEKEQHICRRCGSDSNSWQDMQGDVCLDCDYRGGTSSFIQASSEDAPKKQSRKMTYSAQTLPELFEVARECLAHSHKPLVLLVSPEAFARYKRYAGYGCDAGPGFKELTFITDKGEVQVIPHTRICGDAVVRVEHSGQGMSCMMELK